MGDEKDVIANEIANINETLKQILDVLKKGLTPEFGTIKPPEEKPKMVTSTHEEVSRSGVGAWNPNWKDLGMEPKDIDKIEVRMLVNGKLSVKIPYLKDTPTYTVVTNFMKDSGFVYFSLGKDSHWEQQ